MNRCLRLAPLVLLSALFVLRVPVSASGPAAQPKDIVDTAIAAGLVQDARGRCAGRRFGGAVEEFGAFYRVCAH